MQTNALAGRRIFCMAGSLLFVVGAAVSCGTTVATAGMDANVESAPPLAARMNDGIQSAPPAPPAPPGGVAGSDAPSSRVLGYVNGEVVSYRDVLLEAETRLAAIDDPEVRRTTEETTLLELVIQRLVDRAAVEAQIEVSRDELLRVRSKKVHEIERNGGKLEAFLAERGITAREFDELLRKRVRDERWMYAAMGTGDAPTVRVRAMTETYVRPADVRAFYDGNVAEFHEPATARVRKLKIAADLTAADADAAKAAAKATAEKALARLRAGEDWVPVFREFGADPAEPDPEDGLLVLTEKGKFAPWIEEFAFEKPRGTVSDVLAYGTSFYILRAEGLTPERQIPFDEAQPVIDRQLRNARTQVAYYEVCLSLLESATIQPAELATKLRDYLSTARRKIMDKAGL